MSGAKRTMWNTTARQALEQGAEPVALGPWVGPAAYGDFHAEYDAINARVALHDRSYRGHIDITGADRTTWLSNLITNQIVELRPGEGTYAFATNVQGRILFDLTVLVRDGVITCDVDQRWIEPAEQHLEKYHIVEDVAVRAPREAARICLAGPRVPELLRRFAVGNPAAMAHFQSSDIEVAGAPVTLFRHDHIGPYAVDLIAPADQAERVWQTLAQQAEVTPVGFAAIDAARIACGIPWPVSEINDTHLPAETAQLDRAVSFHKGCYLGQEIVERMRSRQSLARKLVALHVEATTTPPRGAAIAVDGKDVGYLTSVAGAAVGDTWPALGYVKVGHSKAGTRLAVRWDAGQSGAVVR